MESKELERLAQARKLAERIATHFNGAYADEGAVQAIAEFAQAAVEREREACAQWIDDHYSDECEPFAGDAYRARAKKEQGQ